MVSGQGPYLTDADGREYVDLVCSWGPMILGHAHPDVLRGRAARPRRTGFSFGTPSENEVALAEEIVAPGRAGRAGAAGLQRHRGDDERHPPGPRLHRPLARREVRRLLPRPRRLPAGRRPARASRRSPCPTRPGCPRRWRPRRSCCRSTTSPRWRPAFAERGAEIAAVITEASPGNMGVVPPAPGLHRGPAPDHRRPRRAAHLRRGDDRLPLQRGRLVRARGRRMPRARPTCSPSARSWAAASPRPRSAAGPTSWRCSRRSARSTRRAPCRVTRSRPPRGWRPSQQCTPELYARLDEVADAITGAARRASSAAAGVPHVVQRAGQHVQRLLPRRRGRATTTRRGPSTSRRSRRSSTRC